MIDRAKQFIKNAKGIIFDLDGLLIDSEPIWGQTKAIVVNAYGDPETLHISAGTRGMGLRESVIKHKKVHKLKGDINKLIQAYRDSLYAILFAEGKLSLMPGVKAFLQTVKDRQIGLATGGHSAEKIWEILDKADIHKYFSAVVSCDEVEKGKPSPDVYVEAAKRLNLLPSETVVLEDAPNGIISARAAGAVVIGVSKEKKAHEKLFEAGADVVVGSLEELV